MVVNGFGFNKIMSFFFFSLNTQEKKEKK